MILSMAGESNRNSKLSDTLDFLEHFNISSADSTVFFFVCGDILYSETENVLRFL